MCDKNSIFACFDARISQKSHDHPGYRSWFHFSFDHDVAHAFWRHRKQWRWQHLLVQPLRACTRFKTPEQPSSYTKPAAGSQIIDVTFQINFKLICWRLNLHQKVWYKSEKAFGLWSEWHYTTRGLVPWRARDYMYPSTNLPCCVMPFRSQAHAFSLYEQPQN